MSGRDRIVIFPSRANFVLLKQRIVSAQKGLSLLKRKRDALEIHLRKLSIELKANREQLNTVMQEAIFSLAKAKFLCTDFKPATVINPDRADAYLRVKNTKIVGMQVPSWELMLRQTNALNFTGLAGGGRQVQVVREKFQAALKILVAIASLQYSVSAIQAAVKQNNMRVNGLEYVVLPRYQNTVTYIRDELDELEREDFYRLKRSQAKQLKKKSEFIKLMRQREREKDAKDPGYDFTDTHLQTPMYEVISAKPESNVFERRKTVAKIIDKTNVIEIEDPKPLNLDIQFSKAVIMKDIKDENDIKPKIVVTSSSSSSSSEDE
ncbi:V-type proton ATPase subunit D-like [Calliphora vicina]|uniref:V-type proton ATPase subunit D-like n=1 Tax=Calliphora vicina TaxID=7373 RepID=UPI00325C1043